LRRCLDKDPQKRLPHIGVARLEIDEAPRDGAVAIAPANRNTWPRERLAWIAAITIVGAIAAALAVRASRPLPDLPPLRLDVTTPPTTDPVSYAISPDGERLVFAATSSGAQRLLLRSLTTGEVRVLAGTEDGRMPFWSPDNRSLGFFARGKLKRIDLDSGSVLDLTNSINTYGGTWNRDGVIVFSGNASGPLVRISVTGGGGEPATVLAARHLSHRSPTFLPDGRHFLFYVTGPSDVRGVYVAELGHGDARRLVEADTAAIYSLGYLLYVRQSTMFAQPFDAARLVVSGPARAVASDAGTPTSVAAGSASDSGLIAYRSSWNAGRRQLVWRDRSGRELGKLSEPMLISSIALSPDGRRVALGRAVDGNPDIWLMDVDRARPLRLTSHPTIQISAIWSPDSQRVAFQSHQDGPGDLYEMSASGSAATARLILRAAPNTVGMFPDDWSPDGKLLLYQSFDPETRFDIWAVPMQGDPKPFPIVQSQFDERDAQFSPDGKWIAYSSDEAGLAEIYVQPFPGPGGKILISSTGGVQPRWRGDGKELFYLSLDGQLMAVPIAPAKLPESLDPGTPATLFATHVGALSQGITRPQYAVALDGQRFLMNALGDEGNQSPITMIVNWARRLGGGVTR
jgi:Tol biopolymer transport system component